MKRRRNKIIVLSPHTQLYTYSVLTVDTYWRPFVGFHIILCVCVVGGAVVWLFFPMRSHSFIRIATYLRVCYFVQYDFLCQNNVWECWQSGTQWTHWTKQIYKRMKYKWTPHRCHKNGKQQRHLGYGMRVVWLTDARVEFTVTIMFILIIIHVIQLIISFFFSLCMCRYLSISFSRQNYMACVASFSLVLLH